jgi:predicted amidohydrolase
MKPKSKSMRIGLVFPELGKHDLAHFMGVLNKKEASLDLLVFPEGFETISPSRGIIEPESITSNQEVQSLLAKCGTISSQYRMGVILGFQVSYDNRFINGGGNDQYCAYVSPDGEEYVYHKHSTSKYNAFFDSNWAIDNNLRTVQLAKHRIGISVCHDSYISLISRLFAKKGADIWVNISYQNVRPNIWEQVHFTRAVDSNLFSICTLHRNSKEANPQTEPYAFSKDGKIKIRDIESDVLINDFPENKRTGKIYFFEITDYDVTPLDPPFETKLAAQADRLTISREGGVFSLNKATGSFQIVEIPIADYFMPEVLWKHSLKHPDKTTLFIVSLESMRQWESCTATVLKTIKGRTIEFSTAFIFIDKSGNIMMVAYRSSNYKDSRIFYPDGFPVTVDRRYLKGISSTCKISLGDYRNEDDGLYFERINKIITAME